MLDRRWVVSRAAMIAGLFALGAPAFAQTGKKYVCPPCACGEDHVEHDAPGRCPGCGMPLVEKAKPAPPPASGAQQQPSSPETPAQTGAPETAKPAEPRPASPNPPQ